MLFESRRKKIKLEKSALKNLMEDEVKLHYDLIQLRNQYVSHGGFSKFEKNPVVITRTMMSNGEYGYMSHDSGIYMTSLTPHLPLIYNFVDKIIKFVEVKIDASYDKLMNFVVTKFDKKEFEQHAFIPEYKKLVKAKDII